MARSNDLVVVFAGDTFQANHAKNELENNGLTVFLEGEVTGTLAPWHSAPGGAGAVRVTVPNEEAEEAKRIIQQLIDRQDE